MHDVVVVTVLDACHDLVEEVSGFIRWEATSGHDVVEQLTTRYELHDDEDVRWRIDHFVPEEEEEVERMNVHTTKGHRRHQLSTYRKAVCLLLTVG